jgi:hypothetical protein
VSLTKKLLLKPGMRALLINAPEGYAASLEPLPEGVQFATPGETSLDFVQVFVHDNADLARLAPQAIAAVKRDGLLWITYPKGGKKAGTDLNRDTIWATIGKEHDWTGVAMVAVDEKWSAFRARPRELVGK